MTVVIGSDHGGFELKAKIAEHLKEKGYAVNDVGTYSQASCHYPAIAHKLCTELGKDPDALGILICGTGIGMSMAANKHHGIRAALCGDTYSARMTREHNNANVLCMGARVLGEGLAIDIADTFLSSSFLGGRHKTRVDMLSLIEDGRGDELVP